jgi:hypothetical protein
VLGGKGGICLSGLDNVRPKLAGRKLSHEVLCAWGAGQHIPVWLVNQKKSEVCPRRCGLLVLGCCYCCCWPWMQLPAEPG